MLDKEVAKRDCKDNEKKQEVVKVLKKPEE